MQTASDGATVDYLELDYNHIQGNVQGARIERYPEGSTSTDKFKITPNQGASKIIIDIALATT